MKCSSKRKTEMYERIINGMAIATVIGIGFIVTALPMVFDEPEEELVKLNYHKPDVKVETPDVSFAFEVEKNREQARTILDRFGSIKEVIDTVEPECLPPLEYVGAFYVTFYSNTVEQCGNDLGITASGKMVTEDPTCWTVAVDPKVIPLGTKLKIDLEGYENVVFEATDTGSAIKNYDIDVFVASESLSKSLNPISGVDVWIIKD